MRPALSSLHLPPEIMKKILLPINSLLCAIQTATILTFPVAILNTRQVSGQGQIQPVATMIPDLSAANFDSSEEGDVLDLADDEGWDDLEPDLEPVEMVCLMCDALFDNAQRMLQHCKDNHDLDIVSIRKDLGEHAQ